MRHLRAVPDGPTGAREAAVELRAALADLADSPLPKLALYRVADVLLDRAAGLDRGWWNR